MRIRIESIVLSLVLAVSLGGCASTGARYLPPDTVTFFTTDYRFKAVMNSGDDVKGWARDAISTINELQYQLELERNK
jgi:predicted small lipoprotein YifL